MKLNGEISNLLIPRNEMVQLRKESNCKCQILKNCFVPCKCLEVECVHVSISVGLNP